MAEQPTTPKIQIDSDWKAEAQKEKERLAQKERERATAGREGAAGAHELPEANFRSLVSFLASQAIMGLGAMADPQSGRVVIDLEGSRFMIDLLDVLEQKTKGHLTEEEAKELRQILAELRSRYVQITQVVARQMAAQQAGEGVAGVGKPGPTGGSPIIEP